MFMWKVDKTEDQFTTSETNITDIDLLYVCQSVKRGTGITLHHKNPVDPNYVDYTQSVAKLLGVKILLKCETSGKEVEIG